MSYPDGVQASDGTVSLIDDYAHTGEKQIVMASFTEDDGLAGKLVSSGSRRKLPVNKTLGPKIGGLP